MESHCRHATALERPLLGDADRRRPRHRLDGSAATRWRADATRRLGRHGYVFLRDVRSNEVWSAGFQPTGMPPDEYSVIFSEDRVEIGRRDGTLGTTLEVLVSAEHDAEVRRIVISNFGLRVREIEVTSYAEVVLAPLAADIAHPAFSKLFIETEHLAGVGALLATRRRRSPTEPEIWAAHLAVVNGEVVGKREFETDRARFIGRGRDVDSPAAVINGRPLSGATGPVLDPIFALRRRLRIAPGESASIDFWTMVASSRYDVLALIDKHHDIGAFERAAAPRLDPSPGAIAPPWDRPWASQPISRPASPAISSTLRPPCGRLPRSSKAEGTDNRSSGASGYPAICPSSSCVSPTSTRFMWRAKHCWRSNTCG